VSGKQKHKGLYISLVCISLRGWRKIDPRPDYSGSENLIKTAFFSILFFCFVSVCVYTLHAGFISYNRESLCIYTHIQRIDPYFYFFICSMGTNSFGRKKNKIKMDVRL
jgi:hypothetical protein